MSSCVQNVSWGITSQSDPSVGWALCQYNYDYTNFGMGNPNNSVIQLSKWLYDICNGTSSSALNGMDYNKYRIRDSNVVYSIVSEFYNEIFQQGFYNNNPSQNPFSNYDFISNSIQTYSVQSIISPMTSTFQNLYTNSQFPIDLQTALTSSLISPVPFQSGTDYYVTFQITYTMYLAYLESDEKDSYISSLLSGILQDTTGQFNNIQTGQEWSPGNPSLINSVVGTVSAIRLTDPSGNPDYEFINDITPAEWTIENYPYHLFTSIEITAQVDVWSPMLVLYFNTYSNATFDKNTCEKIASTCGYQCNGKSTLPSSCFNLECVDKDSCVSTFTNYCVLSYNPPPYLSHIESDNFLLTNDNENCYCYTSGLSPVGIQQGGNPAAMCFDTNCNSALRNDFGLSDGTCQSYCSTIWDWMNSTDPATQPQNKSTMDWSRFEQLCGKNYQPYVPATINKKVLIFGSLSCIVISMLTFSVCKTLEMSTKKTIIITIIFFVIMMGIVIFLSRDLAGVGKCNGTTFECKSRITNANISPKFCDFILNCECELDSDCSNGCVCVSSTCQPRAGTRPTEIVKKRDIDIVLLIFIIIMGVILPIILILLHRDYHWNISKKIFVPIVILISLLILGFGLYYILRKKSVNVFTGPCCTPQCVNKTCGDNGCGGTCGTCPAGTNCVDGKCTKKINGCPLSTTNQIPVSNLLTGKYYLSTIINGFYSFLNIAKVKTPLTLESTPVLWNYDSTENTLSIGNVYAVSQDLCCQNNCGNTSSLCSVQSGSTGVLYSLGSVDDTIPHNFIIGPTFIFSIDANAYVIPNTAQFGTCPSGSFTVTFTTDPTKAQVWNNSTLPSITGCPFPGSTLSAPLGLKDGNYIITQETTSNCLVLEKNGTPAVLTQTSTCSPWTLSNNTLTQGNITLTCYDPCWNTSCGNNTNASCIDQSSIPSGILFGYILPSLNLPQSFILGTDFIFSLDSKAYVIPDPKPVMQYNNNVCPNCAQGNIYLSLTTDEASAHVWKIIPS